MTTFYPAAGFGGQRFKKTGDFRPPRKGEYYLSGAIPEVYQAPADLSTAFHIMQPVQTRMVEVEVTP